MSLSECMLALASNANKLTSWMLLPPALVWYEDNALSAEQNSSTCTEKKTGLDEPWERLKHRTLIPALRVSNCCGLHACNLSAQHGGPCTYRHHSHNDKLPGLVTGNITT
eukprot:1137816-Pelagomonas_calceolata.AAC.1